MANYICERNNKNGYNFFFFFFLTCPYKRGGEEFKLVISVSLNVVPVD
jgi:hypothetical protein